ncbi:hypothetical protein AB5I41_03815 [Sphingomonas sp. MMS24-JH45]
MPAERAAAMGVLSNVALVDLYSAIADGGDAPAALTDGRDALRKPMSAIVRPASVRCGRCGTDRRAATVDTPGLC